MAHRHQAFGLVVASEIAWPGCPETGDERPATVRLRRGAVDAPDADAPLWAAEIDDREVRLRRRPDGAHVLTFGGVATFLVGAGGRDVVVDTGPDDPGWLRFLLDTVLFTVAHLHGTELLHGAAVAVGGGALAIVGPSGAGKTTLAAQLRARGHALVSDDVLAVDRQADDLVVHPGPPLVNLPRGRSCEGTVLAELGDECWVAVDHAVDEPQPLHAVVELRRHGAGPPVITALPGGPVALLGHAIGFERSAARDRRRFELFADVADRVPLLRLTAGAEVSPEALADALESALPTAPAPTT